MRARRLWPDRNPLRRAADRVEFAIAALLLVALLAGVPLTVECNAHRLPLPGEGTEAVVDVDEVGFAEPVVAGDEHADLD